MASSSPAQSLQFADGKADKLDKLRIGVLGASGYTGSEVCRTPIPLLMGAVQLYI